MIDLRKPAAPDPQMVPQPAPVPGFLTQAALSLAGWACVLANSFAGRNLEAKLAIILAGVVCVVGSMVIGVIRRIERNRAAQVAGSLIAAIEIGRKMRGWRD